MMKIKIYIGCTRARDNRLGKRVLYQTTFLGRMMIAFGAHILLLVWLYQIQSECFVCHIRGSYIYYIKGLVLAECGILIGCYTMIGI